MEPPLFGGNGFILGSLRVDVDDEGVRLGDCVSRPAVEEGEAVPSFESLFFLDDLLSLLPRDSYKEDALLAPVICDGVHSGQDGSAAMDAYTYNPLAEALHFGRSQPTRSRRGRTPKARALALARARTARESESESKPGPVVVVAMDRGGHA